MKPKTIALIIIFSASAMALNPIVSGIIFPFPPLPKLFFQIYEIPIIIAFMLFGFKVAIPVNVLNAIFLLIFYPGPSQPYYWLSLFATIGMMLGIFIAHKLLYGRNSSINKKNRFLIVLTTLAFFCRETIMAPIMFSVLFFDPLNVYQLPIPAHWIIGSVTVPEAIFNSIITLYMIPTSYVVADLINRRLKINSKILCY